MPTSLPVPAPDLSDSTQQAGYVEDAFATGDPFLTVMALKEIGTARRMPVALDEDPKLSEVLRVLADLGLRVKVERDDAQNAPGQV